MKLNLLFIKDGFQYQIRKGNAVIEEKIFLKDENSSEDFLATELNLVLEKKYENIAVISAINHFTLMPNGFSQHKEFGKDLIGLNAKIHTDKEELMLSINKKYGVQFYYTFPMDFYKIIKNKNIPTHFNFSGEKFLDSISPKNGKEIHINLYHTQCEFIALENKKVVLYNNLDIHSEVDFLYFIMFTISKIEFGIKETKFFIYGETTENDTFISELNKFVNKLKIIFDNLPKKQNFILK